MSQLIWSTEALQALAAHFDFLKLKDRDIAGRAAQAIRDAVFSLAKNPQRGVLLADGSDRRKLMVRFGKHGYVIHYYLEGDCILIVRIYHGRQERPF
jgi:plasmid stabilization system protein ParE